MCSNPKYMCDRSSGVLVRTASTDDGFVVCRIVQREHSCRYD